MATARTLVAMTQNLAPKAISEAQYTEFSNALGASSPEEIQDWFRDAMVSYPDIANALYDYPEVEGVPRVRSTVYKATKRPDPESSNEEEIKEKITSMDDFAAFLYFQKVCEQDKDVAEKLRGDKELMTRMTKVVSVSRSLGGKESNKLHQAFLGFNKDDVEKMWSEMRHIAPHLMENEGFGPLCETPIDLEEVLCNAYDIASTSLRSEEGAKLHAFAQLLEQALNEYRHHQR